MEGGRGATWYSPEQRCTTGRFVFDGKWWIYAGLVMSTIASGVGTDVRCRRHIEQIRNVRKHAALRPWVRPAMCPIPKKLRPPHGGRLQSLTRALSAASDAERLHLLLGIPRPRCHTGRERLLQPLDLVRG